jgi:hypothetical protein
MSTKLEHKRNYQAFSAKYKNLGQRITNYQSGYVEHFGDAQQNAVDTIRQKDAEPVNKLKTWQPISTRCVTRVHSWNRVLQSP